MGEFNEKSIQALLSSIPSDIPSQELCIWLKGVVVPFMWRVLPKGQVWYMMIMVSAQYCNASVGSSIKSYMLGFLFVPVADFKIKTIQT